MQSFLYHFSDTVRLPWIMEAGELRPSQNRIGGFPVDFLWATSDARGDRTSSAAGADVRDLWRSANVQLIRFTLDTADFDDWEETGRRLGRTEQQISVLKISAVNLGEPDASKWRCRHRPLGVRNALQVEAKSYVSGRWVPIDSSDDGCRGYPHEPDFRGFTIGDYVYVSTPE